MGWLKQALTGPDNQTVAIGRLVGSIITIVLLVGLPVAAAATVITGKVVVADWTTLLTALSLYVPAIVGAMTGLIWGTNYTEPKAKDPDND